MARRAGILSDSEIALWRERDLAVGRRITAPVTGNVIGVGADGALLVRQVGANADTVVHAGSLVFAEAQADANTGANTGVASCDVGVPRS